MFRVAVFFLLLVIVSGLFSFGVVDDIYWFPAQITFGVSLVLFIIAAIVSYNPSQQIHIPRGRSSP